MTIKGATPLGVLELPLEQARLCGSPAMAAKIRIVIPFRLSCGRLIRFLLWCADRLWLYSSGLVRRLVTISSVRNVCVALDIG